MPGKTYTAKNGAKYVKNARGQVRFVSGASKAYLAKIRKKRGKKKGGSVATRQVKRTKNMVKGTAKGLKRGGGVIGRLAGVASQDYQQKRSDVRAVRKFARRRGGGLALHNTTAIKYRGPGGIHAKTSAGF